jgi:hypothetical protein
MKDEIRKEDAMTSSTVIAQLHLTDVERRRRTGIESAVREARKGRRRRFFRRPRGATGASPPGAGGRLLQL